MENHAISGILLAGGYSSRMGRDKAELAFRGQSMLQYQADKLRALGLAELIVAGYDKPLPNARVVPDIYPHLGPLSGLHAGLSGIQSSCALVLAVDTPLVPESLLRALMELHTRGATITLADGRPEPLIGVYDKSLAQACERVLQGEDTSMRRFLKTVSMTTLEYQGDRALLMNCNTPEDYESILKYGEA